jgi:hypothetical protein
MRAAEISSLLPNFEDQARPDVSAEQVFKHGGEGLAEIAARLMATSGAAEARKSKSRSRCRMAPWSKR